MHLSVESEVKKSLCDGLARLTIASFSTSMQPPPHIIWPAAQFSLPGAGDRLGVDPGYCCCAWCQGGDVQQPALPADGAADGGGVGQAAVAPGQGVLGVISQDAGAGREQLRVGDVTQCGRAAAEVVHLAAAGRGREIWGRWVTARVIA